MHRLTLHSIADSYDATIGLAAGSLGSLAAHTIAGPIGSAVFGGAAIAALLGVKYLYNRSECLLDEEEALDDALTTPVFNGPRPVVNNLHLSEPSEEFRNIAHRTSYLDDDAND